MPAEKKYPFFSIVTPVLDGVVHVPAYARTLSMQEFQDWEAIVVVDGSSDGTYEALLDIASRDSRFRVLKNRSPRSFPGPWKARNIGLDESRGKYICFLDIDDQWLPCKLAVHHRRLTVNVGLGLIVSPYFRACFDRVNSLALRTPPNPALFRLYLSVANPIPILTACVKRDLLSDLRFKPVRHEDFLFWHDLVFRLNSSQMLVEREPLAIYRIDSSSLSGNKLRSCVWIWKCYRHIGYSPPIACLALAARGLLQLWLLFSQRIRDQIAVCVKTEIESMARNS